MNQLFNSTLKYCVWLLMCVSCCLPSLGQSQATEEEKAYAMRIYQMQAAEDEAGFYQAEQDFMNYLLERKDWAKYYNVWMNRVVFDINQKHFSRAFTEIRHITEDIRKRGNTEFLYIPNQALGLYYVNRGHHEMGSRYFLKALESVDTVANPLAVANLNLSLAQAFSFFDPDRALSHLDRLPSLYDNPTTESGVLGYRCIINYEKGDLEAFSRSFERYDSLRRAYPEVFNEVNYANVMVYHSLSINDYEAALSWCDSITVPEESAEIRTKVYAAMGDWKNAYKELSSRDSLQLQSLNEVLEEDIEELSHSIDLLESEREKAKLRKTQIIVVSLSALLAILALVLALYYRYKKNRRLRQQYTHLQEALAIRRSFVTSIYQRLQSPVSVLKGYARIINNPDFRLTMEQREKSYHDIAAAGRSIETLLEPVLDSYIHDNMSISAEQRQLCQDALGSPLQTLISTAEIIEILQETGKPIEGDATIGKLIQIKDALMKVKNNFADFDDIMADHEKFVGLWRSTTLLEITTDGQPTGKKCRSYYDITSTAGGTSIIYATDTQKDYSTSLSIEWKPNEIVMTEAGTKTNPTDDTYRFVPLTLVCSPDSASLLRCVATDGNGTSTTIYLRKVTHRQD